MNINEFNAIAKLIYNIMRDEETVSQLQLVKEVRNTSNLQTDKIIRIKNCMERMGVIRGENEKLFE